MIKKLMAMMAVAGLMVFTACDEVDDILNVDGPSLSVSVDPVSNEDGVINLSTGETLTIDISAETPGGFNVFRVSGTGLTTQEINRNDLDLPAGSTSASVELNVSFEVAGDYSISITVVDDNNRTAEVSYDIVVVEALNSFSTKLLYAPTDNRNSATFFSTNNGTVYSMNDVNNTTDAVSQNIDFGYFYGANFQATLASPAAYPFEYGQDAWGTRNDTKIKKTNLSNSSFLEATSASIEAAFNDSSFGPSEGQARALAAGDVLVFRTDSNKEGGAKYGLILVNAITGTSGSNDFIDIDVVVQK